MKKELDINGAKIVSGDTKVVPKGAVDKLFINTSGVGEIKYSNISASNLEQEHTIIVSRDIGAHGATIFASREGIELDSNLQSDCASLYPIVQALIDADVKLIALRDATRGGVSAVLNEWAKTSDVCIEVSEDSIPVSQEVKGISEFLGFEPLSLANEGTFLIATTKEDEQKVLDILKSFNSNATIIGKVTNEHPQKVVLKSSWGTKRFLDMPTGELLPRIC
jgi:hydrogenase expression/formation protein HypE